MNMHGTHGCARGLPERWGRGVTYGLYRNVCTVRGETQKDLFVSLDFTVNYAGRTVFIYQTQKEALEKLSNEYTIQTYSTYNVLYEGHLL